MAAAEDLRLHDKGSTFLAMRWHELFDQYTPDTFQPQLLTIPCLIEEAVEVASLSNRDDRWKKHLCAVQQEISGRLYGGVEKSLLTAQECNVVCEISTSKSTAEVGDLSRLLLLEGFTRRFSETARNRLSDLADAGVEKKKEDTDLILTLIGSQAFRRGCDATDYSDYDSMPGCAPQKVVEWILESIPQGERSFSCIVAVEMGEPEEQAGIRSVLQHRGITLASPKIPGLSCNGRWFFFKKTVKALKDNQALNALRVEIQDALNLLGFYQQSRTPRVRDRGWIYNGDSAREVDARPRRFDNLHPRRNAVTLAGRATKAISGLRGEAALASALDLHGQALRAEEDALRLVNLWSAVECLASLVDGGSIIERVERLICPIVTWRRIDKILRYLAINLHFWLKENPKIERSSIPFPLGPNDAVEPERILTIVSKLEGDHNLNSLMALTTDHPLLLYRVCSCWKFASNPREMQKRQAKSEEALRWHLSRIYRARNLLVHHGIESRFVPQLANHLQHYLSMTLSRIMHGLTFGEDWTSRDSISHWRSKYLHVNVALKEAPESLVVGDFFPEEVQDPGFPVW
ncbi:hypothetical protein [Haloferula sp. A504]|uniref:hypothetical protein n=1 Tax=Haloferula sp. A504 TaxID=3373601 RepID=UPI0037BF0ADB